MAIKQSVTKILVIIFLNLILINCPKRVSVKTEKIEVIYISSLLDDIKRSEPYLCRVKNSEGIKVGYLNFDSPFMPHLFQRLGFYRLLDEVPLDFLITNSSVYGEKFLSLPIDLGYGFKNYKGIRFGVFTQYRDSLSISQQVKLAMVKERSDVLWVIDKNLLSSPPMQIDFIIRNRILKDTMIKKIEAKIDTTLLNKLNSFNELLHKTLNTSLFLNNSTIADFIFSKLKQKVNINILITPKDLIKDNTPKDSISLDEFLRMVNCAVRFKITELTKSEVNKLLSENDYTIWGSVAKKNLAYIPDKEGEYLFDLIFY